MRVTVIWLLIGGLFFAVVGTAITYASWPDTVMTSEGFDSAFGYSTDPTYEDTGSWFGVACGGLMAFGGQVAITVAIVAMGARLAMEEFTFRVTPTP